MWTPGLTTHILLRGGACLPGRAAFIPQMSHVSLGRWCLRGRRFSAGVGEDGETKRFRCCMVDVIKRVNVIYISVITKNGSLLCQICRTVVSISLEKMQISNVAHQGMTKIVVFLKKGTTWVNLFFTARWEEKDRSQAEEFSSDVFCLSLQFLPEMEGNAIGPVYR